MKNYSFLSTVLLINGIEITGFDEGDDVITAERLADSATHKVGVDGEMTVSVSADSSGTLTFRLMQSSSSNRFLSDIVNRQESSRFAAVSIAMQDTKSGDKASGSLGYITRPAPMVRGQSVNSQEWVVVVERLDLIYA